MILQDGNVITCFEGNCFHKTEKVKKITNIVLTVILESGGNLLLALKTHFSVHKKKKKEKKKEVMIF